MYYLADRSNNAVDVVDATDGSFIKYLGKGQFAAVVTGAPSRSGPDGVVTDKDGNVWAGDGLINGVGHSSLKAFDPRTGDLIANIDNGGAARADELAYGDVNGGRILIANPNEPGSAFVTLVNTRTHNSIGKVVYDAGAGPGLPPPGHGFNTNFGTPPSQHGLEQPVFAGGRFYLNVPATIQNPGGEIDVFSANKAQIVNVIPLHGASPCGGTGLAVGPQNDLIVECSDSVRVIDFGGHMEAMIPELVAQTKSGSTQAITKCTSRCPRTLRYAEMRPPAWAS